MTAQRGEPGRADIGIGGPKRRRGALLRYLSQLIRDQRGVSAVELGLAAAFILPPVASVFDFGMAFSEKIKLQQAVQAGAQYASMNVWDSSSSPTNITNTVKNALPTSLRNLVSVSPAPSEACYCPTGTGLQSADSLSSCGTTTCSDGESSGYYVTVTATLGYSPVAPYSFAFMSNPTTLSATSVVRVQ